MKGTFHVETLVITTMCLLLLASTVTANAADMKNRNSESGTPITLTVNNTVIPAVLNETAAARDLVSRLPYTICLNRYATDFCGVMSDPLRYEQQDIQVGWLDGDLSFSPNGDYFVIFFGGQETSESGGDQCILGKVNAPLTVIQSLSDGAIDVRIDLAQ